MRTWQVGAAIAVALASTMAVGRNVSAAPAGGPFHFLDGSVVLDTVNTQALQPGVELPLTGLDDHYLDIEAYGAVEAGVRSEGLLWLGPCGSGTKAPISRLLHTDFRHIVFVPAGSCLTSSATTNVRASAVGVVSASDNTGYRFVGVEPIEVGAQLRAGQFEIEPGPGVPDGAAGIVVEAEVDALATNSALRPNYTFIACGGSVGQPIGAEPHRQVVYVRLDGAGLCAAGNGAPLSVKVLGYFTDALASGGGLPPAYRFTVTPKDGLQTIEPQRILDTRSGLGAPARSAATGETLRVAVGAGVPADATAMTLNLTAVDPGTPGYVTAHSCDEPMPDTSNINFTMVNVANQVTVEVGPSRQVCLFTSGPTHLVADVNGTWSPEGYLSQHAIAPARLLDTRAGATPTAGQTIAVHLAGQVGVPADASAATFTLTVDRPVGTGFVTAFPCDTARPTASNLNFVADQTVANLVTVPLAADGTVCLYTDAAADLLVDVSAYFADDAFGARLELDGPHRLADTRADSSAVPAAGFEQSLTYLPTLGPTHTSQADSVAQSQVTAGLLNVTATQATEGGFATTDCGTASAATSLMNFVPGRDASSQALSPIIPPGSGRTCVEISASTHLIVDSFGYFTTAIDLQQQLVQPAIGT